MVNTKVNNPKTKTGATPVVHHTSEPPAPFNIPPFAKAGGSTIHSKEVPKVKKDVIQFRDPVGRVYLKIDTQLIKGGKMPDKKQTTKKAAPVKKAEVKTATPKPEPTVVVEVLDFKNPQMLEQLYVKQGKSAGEIARQFNVSRGVVLHHMRKAGITITTRKATKPGAKSQYKNPTWLRKAIEAGKTVYQIAKDQGVSYTSVRMQAIKLQPMPVGNKATAKKTNKQAAKK
jgi:DNA-binding CsgD family transcriptional regulator